MSRAERNPFVGTVYIPDNPRMETPPAWFLQRIYDYDAMLVLIPSRMRPFHYVLARRKQFSAGLRDQAIEESITNSDTRMCFTYGVVPVALLFKHGPVWDADRIIAKLMARDTWALGGADKVADMLEEQEAAEKEAERKRFRQEMWDRSGDAWRSYQLRTGAATGYGGTMAQSSRRTNKQAPSGSTAGSGSLFVGE